MLGRAREGFKHSYHILGHNPEAATIHGSKRMSEADPRLTELNAWIREVEPAVSGPPVPASVDASFRRYFRIPVAGGTRIVMDAPPGREPVAPFIHVAGLLRAAGLHAPEILAADEERGFLLLSDLGRETYLDALHNGSADPGTLYEAALDALVTWQVSTREDALPPYDEALLRRELDLFPDWYTEHLPQFRAGDRWRADWAATCDILVSSALEQPQVFVHRDYIPRNLMVSDPLPGIIDFQDAVIGPLTYDLVSLIRDAFVSWPEAREAELIEGYRQRARTAGLPIPDDAAALRRTFDRMAAQRHLKVLGIFARLRHRDGKANYLRDAPRFLAYLERETRDDPALAPLRRLLADLPEAR